ncbi:MAG: coiled coil domain-containing protein [Anaerolineae bacterium]|nr:coiled coil domain-containing protein [Anaerolineae bacterium]
MSEKETYHKQVEARLEELEARINVLQAKAESAKAEAKVEYLETIETLRAQRRDLQERLQSLAEAGEEAWVGLRQGVDKGLDDLATALDQAADRIGRELA